MRKAAAALACCLLLASCNKQQPDPGPAEPVRPKFYTVVQDGRIAGIHLLLVYDQISSATFKTPDGRRVVYHGTFYYQEE